MLKDDFFSVVEISTEESSVKAVLELNDEHKIFQGHFPGTPVVPGVCMMQMIKEMVEAATGKSLMLSKAASMKFLSVIDPRVNKAITVDLSYRSSAEAAFEVSASLNAEARVCFKFKGTFVVRS